LIHNNCNTFHAKEINGLHLFTRMNIINQDELLPRFRKNGIKYYELLLAIKIKVMKLSFKVIFSLFTIIISLTAYGQKNYNVLLPELQGKYEGKIKNRLAHGKGKAVGQDTYEGKFKKGLPSGQGVYTWSNGDVYQGLWKKGLKNGLGQLTILKDNGEREVTKGIWKNNSYLGPKPKRPKVTENRGVARYNFKRVSDGDRILVGFFTETFSHNPVINLQFESNSGQTTSLSNYTGYESLEYPVTIRVSYMTRSKLGTSYSPVSFEFVISQPGDWRVNLTN